MKHNAEFIEELVSIIMPAYNSEAFIKESIQSVLNQTYKNWELIIVDDCSNDNTVNVVKSFKDERIRILILDQNSGAAAARNKGIEAAAGEFLAFLDSDDLWTKEKLEKQLTFMKDNNYHFTCTQYAEIDKNNTVNSIIKVNNRLDYDGVLKYCPGNSTVIYNAKALGKFYAPLIRRRNDFALWLQVIKEAKHLYGLHEPYSIYRVRKQSLSSDKKKLIKYQWKVFREIEKLTVSKSVYLLVNKIINVVFNLNHLK